MRKLSLNSNNIIKVGKDELPSSLIYLSLTENNL